MITRKFGIGILACLAVALLTPDASAVVVLESDFDGNTGAADAFSGGPGSGTVSGISYTGTAAASASTSLTAIAPGTNGFVFSGPLGSSFPNVNQDVVTISGNLNVAGLTADPRGFSLTFTPTVDRPLSLVSVTAGHFNGNGGFQGFLSDINVDISTTGGTPLSIFSGTDILDNGESDPAADGTFDGFPNNPAPVGPAIAYEFDATGVTLLAGTEYTFSATQNNLQSGGSFAYFDGFSVQAVPEPSSVALLAFVGTGLAARRRRK